MQNKEEQTNLMSYIKSLSGLRHELNQLIEEKKELDEGNDERKDLIKSIKEKRKEIEKVLDLGDKIAFKG